MKKLLTIAYLLGAFAVFGQNQDVPFDKKLFQDRKAEFQDAVKEIKEGDFHFFDGSNADLNNALYHYLNAQEFNPYSSYLNFKIGVCYLYTNQKFKAIDYLKFAYKVNPDVDENIKFYLAQSYQLNAEFDKAIELYTEHKDGIRAGDDIQRAFINKKIKECRTGKEMKANPVRVWVDNLGDSINTKYPEFSPVISADNRVMFYTARRPDSQGDKVDNAGYHYEDVYSSHRGFGEDWGIAQNLGSPVNTKSHDATVGLAPDGKSLIIYRGINSKNGDLFITKELEDGSWEEPKSLGDNINTKYHESSATLSFDEKTLYFVSDQPGGYGQHDIYVSNWDEAAQEWGPAENLGDDINTEFEEKGVFFHPDGKTLYFSSDGHNTMGGLDVFKTELDPETQRWSKPVNLGYPISTPDDDIYFVVTGDERYAYYSSYRADGFGEKDLYKITFLGPKKNPMIADAEMIGSTPALQSNPTLVNLFDAKGTDIVATNNNNSGTNNNTNNSSNDAEIKKLQNQVNNLSNQINDFKDEIADLKKQLQNQNNNNNNNNSNNTGSNDEDIKKLENEIADLKDEIKRLNDELKNNNNSGNNNSNNGTSSNNNTRPKVFILKGTISDCASNVGISRANLSVTNERTGEKIKDLSTQADGSYTIALTPGEKYGLTATAGGYEIYSDTYSSSKNDENTEVTRNLELCKAEAGSSFALRNIYFEFDKFDLRVKSSNELDKLAKIMKDRPTMIIELGGHTDRRGSNEYNLVLSRERAKIAKDYLVRKGITSDRIRTKGYGESQPEISGATISSMSSRKEKEAAHAKNRRTVVTIISE